MKRTILLTILLVSTICMVLLPSLSMNNAETVSLTPTSGVDTTQNLQVTCTSAGNAVANTAGVLNPRYPDSINDNDLALLQVTISDTTNYPTLPEDWTLLYGPDSTGISRQWVFYRFVIDEYEKLPVPVYIGGSSLKMARIYTFRNVAAEAFTQGGGFQVGTDYAILAQDVTTSRDKCLAVSFVYVTDDNSLGSFNSEIGGDWTETKGEYTASYGDNSGCIQLQIAPLASAGSISGGSYIMSSSASWSVRAFALIPVYSLSSEDLNNLASSDDARYSTQTTWPNSEYDNWPGRCLHFNFTNDFPEGAIISSVFVTNEFFKAKNSDPEMKMRVWDGSTWSSEYSLSVSLDEQVQTTDISSFITSASKVNALEIELKGASGSTKTCHDQIKVDVTYTMRSFSITVNQVEHGSITPGTTIVNYGGSQDFTITPSTGYYIESITVDGCSITVSDPCSQTISFTNVQADHTITASFALTIQSTLLTISVDPATVDKGSRSSAIVSGYLTSGDVFLEGFDIAVSYNDGRGWVAFSQVITGAKGYYSINFPVSPDMENGYVAFSAEFAGSTGYSAVGPVFTGSVGGEEGNLHVVPEFIFCGLAALGICLVGYVFFIKTRH